MSIRVKLTLLILALVAVPLIFISTFTFAEYEASLEQIRLSQLQDLARFKADAIETYFAGLATHIETAQSFYNIRKNLPVLIRLSGKTGDPAAALAKKTLNDQFRRSQKVMGLTDIMLADSLGKIVYMSNPNHEPKDYLNVLPESERAVFQKGEDTVFYSDIVRNRALGNKFEMLVTTAAYDLDGRRIGIIAFEVDMNPIYKLLQDTAGLGMSGEVLIGVKEGDEILYITPLRDGSNAGFNRRIKIGGPVAGPIQNAVNGNPGAGVSVDYRGQQVIAAWRFISSVGWGLVAKIDTREAFAAVARLRRLTRLVFAMVFAAIAILTFMIAQSITRPIVRLSKGAEIIGQGNLEHKVGTRQKDEVGQLSRAIDSMTINLKEITASRDELDKEIADRKKVEQELRRSNENLEQFAYVASHDLQEPLRAMGSFSQLLEARYKARLEGDGVEFLGFIVEAAKRMQKLITDLLAYSRIGRSESEMETVDCNSVLGKVVASLQTQIEESGAAVTKDELPSFVCNDTEWFQLFQNLIGNAIKFRGDRPPLIHVSAEKKGSDWLFSVRDNGIGIEERYRERIFLIFQRLHGRDKYPGTGIGLAIVKKIVETRGGRIWVDSIPGQGSTFYFTIPENTKQEETA